MESRLGKPAPKESPMIVDMFARTRGIKPAVLSLTRLLAAKNGLEIIAIILLQISLAELPPAGA